MFVNSSLASIQETLDFCGLDAAQLHGRSASDLVFQLKGRAYEAFSVQSLAEAETKIAPYRSKPTIEGLPGAHIDAYHPDLYGGTGQPADWSIAAKLAVQCPLMLAGGLTPANVADAIRSVKPWGVDVGSGVEAVKGKKDHAKVKAFIKAARAA